MDQSTDTIKSAQAQSTAMSAQPTFYIPPSLASTPYAQPVSSYLTANPHLTFLVVGCAVFKPSAPSTPSDATSPPQILLTQRSATNYVPLKWEIPGGKCEPGSGETVLEAAARELREETGLRAKGFVRVVDEGTEFGDDGKRGSGKRVWRKITFEVEVEDGEGEGGEGTGVGVVVDPVEHADYAWVTEEEVMSGKMQGEGGEMELEFTFEEQREVILRAFELRGGEGA